MSDDHNTATRLTTLENLLTFQEDTINSISDVVAEQQKTIDTLSERLRRLESKVREVDMGGSIVNPDNEPPPPHF